MASLARQLQHAFVEHCPAGWECVPEARVVSAGIEAILGYAPQADVLFRQAASGRRIWVELEVSRADPVANHAKFASAHLVEPFPRQDTFLSMVSHHVQNGRRNLAAHTIGVMRALGLRAFQTHLLPQCSGAEIKRLNHLSPAILRDEPLDARAELRRLFAVTDALGRIAEQDIHFCANDVEVLTNIHVWNREIQDPASRTAWGRRRVRYFAAAPRHRLFAPSKFAAYIKLAASDQPAGTIIRSLTGMSLRGYDSIPYEHPIFDGGRAWHHLQDRLRYTAVPLSDLPAATAAAFARWQEATGDAITIDPQGAILLFPPVSI
jgi:hypothetical protein